MKQTAFEEEKNGEYIPCLKNSVPIFVSMQMRLRFRYSCYVMNFGIQEILTIVYRAFENICYEGFGKNYSSEKINILKHI